MGFVLVSSHVYATPNIKADLNGDVVVNSLDISKLASCFAQDPLTNTACNAADVDVDGDIDRDDFSFVSARLGQAYPELLYAPVTIPGGTASVFVDVNDDGVDDIIDVDRRNNEVKVLLGNGGASFQTARRFSVDDNPASVVYGDVNTDDNVDLVVINQASDHVSVLLGNGNGSFQTPYLVYIGGITQSLDVGDMNADGAIDLVTANSDGSNILVLFGDGEGNFQVPQNVADISANRLILDDMNGDGVLDIVSRNTAYPETDLISILLGDGEGGFQAREPIDVSNMWSMQTSHPMSMAQLPNTL